MKSHRGYTYHGLVTLMLLLSYHAHAQNLVINPSFEETVTDCSEFDGERFLVDLPGTWDNAGIPSGSDTCSSPDLYSVCNVIIIPGFDTSTVMAVPNNLLGWQQPHSGTRYVGIVTHLAVGGNYREYIQGQLSQPLTAGQVYSVSLFVSAANEVPFATNNIGVYFSDTHYQNDPCSGKLGSFITELPQLNYQSAPITDTLNWTPLQWEYTAMGGEQYLVIGNFFDTTNTTVVSSGNGTFAFPFAYYYIDDVSVVQSSVGMDDTHLIEAKTEVWPNPATSMLSISTDAQGLDTTTIYTLSGQKLREQGFTPQVDISALPSGIYFIEVRGDDTVVRKRFVKI